MTESNQATKSSLNDDVFVIRNKRWLMDILLQNFSTVASDKLETK
jgi:hypothetical protein